MYADTDSIKGISEEEYKRNKATVSSVYGVMCARGPLTNTGRVRQKVRELLDTPDPWEDIVDDGIDNDAYDYDSSYPSREDVMEAVNEWLNKNRALLNSITPL